MTMELRRPGAGGSFVRASTAVQVERGVSTSLLRSTSAIRVYEDPSVFEQLEGEWKSLFLRHGGWNVFLSWHWFCQWWGCFGAGNQPRILAMSHGGKLVGVVPLMVETDGTGRPQLALIGSDRTTDYGDVLVDPEFVDPLCDALADFVLGDSRSWDRAELRSLPATSPLLGPFLTRVRRRMATDLRESDTCPRLRLAPTWDGYLATLSKKDRHELRRKIRRAQASGDRTILSLTSPEEAAAGLESFFRLHRASGPEKAAFLDDTMVSFFRSMALTFAREGWLRVNLMRVDGRDVAASISFSLGDRVLLYNSGLDPDYRVHSVGIALHAAEIQQAIDQGKAVYDFLRGDEPYKYGFGAEDSPVYTLTLLPAGAAADGGGEWG